MNWPTKKLGEVCDLVRGSEPGSAAYIKESDDTFPFLRVGDLSGKVDNPKFVSNGLQDLTIVDPNEILVTFDGTPGLVTKGWKGAISSGIRVIRNIKKDEILKDFLFYYLQTPPIQEIIRFYTTGVTILHASRAIPHIKIKIPPLSIQQKIVERLDAIKKTQELNEKQISLADELFQSLLCQKLKPKKNWEVKKFQEISSPQYGYTASAKESGEYRFIRITDIDEDGELRNADKKYVSEDKKMIKQYILKQGDLLLARTGATFGKILYFDVDDLAIFASYLIRINPNERDVLPKYIWLFSRSKDYWKQAKLLMTGSGQPQFNANKLKQIKIPLPSLKTQRQIVKKLSAVQEYKKKLLEQKELLQELFESTLNKAMKGGL